MNFRWKKVTALLTLCLPLVISGCGDDGDGGPGTAALTGIAVKGPIKGAQVAAYQLQANGTRGILLGSATTADNGSFSIPIPASQTGDPLVVTVTGQSGTTYASETRGTDVSFSSAESFSAAINGAASNVNITVSPLTEAAFQKLPQILAAKPGTASTDKLASSIIAANNRIGSLFNIQNITVDPATDTTYRAALIIIDQMVEDSKTSGAVTNTSAVMTLINSAVSNVAQPAYQSFLQAFNTAADKAKAANPGAIAAAADTIKTRAATPAAEIDFSDATPPTAPTNLTAMISTVSATTSTVILTWSPSTDNTAVAGYQVFRDGFLVATVTTAGYTDPSAKPDVSNSYTVSAFDAAGNRSAPSSPLSIKPNPAILNITITGQVHTGLP